MKTKFLVMMGPSGVGKNTLMHELQEIDRRFVQVRPHVTRPLRIGETERVSISLSEMEAMRRRGEATQINNIYGLYSAVLPKKTIEDALVNNLFPMVDYKIQFVTQLATEFRGRLFCVYLLPPSVDAIQKRLQRIGRTLEPERVAEDTAEVANLDKYSGLINLKIVNEEGLPRKVAEQICEAYLRAVVAVDSP